MDTPATPNGAAPRIGSRRLWFRILIAIAVLALLWSAAWFYVPPILEARSSASPPRRSVAASGSARRLQPVDARPHVDDLAIAGADASAPPSSRSSASTPTPRITSLLRLAPVIDALEIDAPMLA